MEIPSDDPDFTEREIEYLSVLRERHERIKQERRSILTTLISLSGGAIVLSASLLEKIASLRAAMWLLVLSWSLLGLSVIAALLGIAAMTRQSMKYQGMLEQNLFSGSGSRFLFRVPSTVRVGEGLRRAMFNMDSKRGRDGIYLELAAGCLFVAGAILLGVFAVLNLTST